MDRIMMPSGPKQAAMIRKLGIKRGEADLIRLLITGEIEPGIFQKARGIKNPIVAIMTAVNEVVYGNGIFHLKRNNIYIDGDWYNVTHLYLQWVAKENRTFYYSVVERRFIIGDIDKVVDKAEKDTRGRQLVYGGRLENIK